MDAREVNRVVVEQFRAGGPVDGMHRDRLLLLTTIGRRSGRPRTTPMMRVRANGSTWVVASANAADADPAWLRDLEITPDVRVEEDGVAYDAVARVLRGPDRTAVWDAIVRQAPFFAEHQTKVAREIPVVELVRRDA